MLDPNQPPLPGPRAYGRPVATPAGDPILLTPQWAPAGATTPFTLTGAQNETGAQAETGAATPPPTRRRSRGAILAIVAGVVTLVVLAGAGTVAAKLWLGSTGALPEGAVPSSTAAFVRINLSPGYSQRVKTLALLKKFPKAGSGTGRAGSDELGSYKRNLVTDLDLGVSYDEVSGWLGDRAGVGVWADNRGYPVMLVALASDDDAAARKALRAARDRVGSDHLGFVVSGGYALLAKADKDAQAAADDAARTAAKASLGSSSAFRSAAATLPGDQPLLAWADLGHVGEIMRAVIDEESRMAGAPTPDFGNALPDLGKLTGVVVAGAQAVDNGVEVRIRAIGVPQPTGATTDAKAALDGMPGNAALAMSTTGPGTGIVNLGPLGMLLGGDLFGGGLLGGGLPSGGLSGVPGSVTTDPSVDPSVAPGVSQGLGQAAPPGVGQAAPPGIGPDGKIRVTGPDGKEIVIDPNDPSTFPTAPVGPAGAGSPVAALGTPDAAFGATLPAILTALGSAKGIGLTLTDTPAGNQACPPLSATVDMGDGAAATALAGDLTTLAGSGVCGTPDALTVTRHDNSVQVRSSGFAPAGGKLADNALYAEAMAGAPTAPVGAAYIDVHKLVTATGESSATMGSWAPIKAIGVASGRSGDDGVALIRIVIG